MALAVHEIQNGITFVVQKSSEFQNDAGENAGIDLNLDQFIPPIPPGNVRRFYHKAFVKLEWSGTGSDIVHYYVIYRKNVDSNEWKGIAIIPMQGDNRGKYSYKDFNIEKKRSYNYVIVAVDKYENESKHSKEVLIDTKH